MQWTVLQTDLAAGRNPTEPSEQWEEDLAQGVLQALVKK